MKLAPIHASSGLALRTVSKFTRHEHLDALKTHGMLRVQR